MSINLSIHYKGPDTLQGKILKVRVHLEFVLVVRNNFPKQTL